VLGRRLLLAAGGGGPFTLPGLTQWRAAVVTKASSPVDIVCIGDSITEGYQATTSANTWVDKLAAALEANYGGHTAIYRPGSFGTPGDPPTYPLPWTLVNPNPDTDWGLGRKTNVIFAGESMTIAGVCTGFSIVYTTGPSGASFGSFKYAVDGGAPTTVSALHATVLGGRLVTVTGLSAASHSVVITPDTAYVPIEGIIFYNGTETSGFRVWEGGHSGYRTSDYINGSFPNWIDLLGNISPDLAIIMLGRNEWATSVSVATYIANLTTLIANVRGASSPTPSVLLVAEMQGSDTPGLPWSDYVAGLAALVASDGNLAYVDLNPIFGGYTVPPSGPLYNADLEHPNDAGMIAISNAITARII
jgi:lysophospholipase L1-like esterase